VNPFNPLNTSIVNSRDEGKLKGEDPLAK